MIGAAKRLAGTWVAHPRSNIESEWESDCSQNGASKMPSKVSWPPQALFTRRATRPCSRTTRSNEARTSFSRV